MHQNVKAEGLRLESEPLFDTFVIVDWSADGSRRPGATASGSAASARMARASAIPRTAMRPGSCSQTCWRGLRARRAGRCGLRLPFGYPAGLERRLGLAGHTMARPVGRARRAWCTTTKTTEQPRDVGAALTTASQTAKRPDFRSGASCRVDPRVSRPASSPGPHEENRLKERRLIDEWRSGASRAEASSIRLGRQPKTDRHPGGAGI